MPREIKFRQFHLGRFHIWGYLEDGFISPLIANAGEKLENQQYTGLKDKNGKEIYEGDIVETISGERKWKGTIHWDRFAWFVDKDFIDATGQVYEVIGNIYEHRHLLK